MYLEERIEKLEEQLQNASLPAIYYKELQDYIYNELKECNYSYKKLYTLTEGYCTLDFETILQMMHDCAKNGDYFIFLCGSKVFLDCCSIYNDEFTKMNIKILLDNRVIEDEAYFIPVKNGMTSDTPIKFKREMYILKGE